jgi:hypothetical protein
MKKKSLKIIFCIIMLVFTISSCGRFNITNITNIKNEYIPVKANIENEVIVIIDELKPFGYKNFEIKNADTGKIVFSMPELTSQRVIMVPKGNYTFYADGVSRAQDEIRLDSDCRITYIRRGRDNFFSKTDWKEPPAVMFLDTVNNPVRDNILIHEYNYYVSILNFDDLDYNETYQAVIREFPNIKFEIKKTINNRLVSDRPIHLPSRDNLYNVLITNNANFRAPLPFRVKPREPFRLTITNSWQGKPLEWAKMEYFIIRDDDEYLFKPEMNSIDYIKVQGRFRSITVYTSKYDIDKKTIQNEIIIDPMVSEDQKILLAIEVERDNKGQKVWFTQVITAKEANKTRDVIWDLPNKGKNRSYKIPIDTSIGEKFRELCNSDGIKEHLFYFKTGDENSKDIYIDVVNSSNNYELATTNGISPQIDNGRVYCIGNFDLSNICVASRIIYLLCMKTSDGAFIMEHVFFESPNTPPDIIYIGEDR